MSKIGITVEPTAKTRAGWLVHLTSWRSGTPTRHILEPNGATGGKFKFVSKADLPAGIYSLTLHVFEGGNGCSATVDGKPPIEYPFNSQWPLAVTVPATVSQNDGTYNFEHGG